MSADLTEGSGPAARPRLLDLFCGAGGCSMGYHRASFDVVGVDNRPQPRYPFPFVQADALDFLATHGRQFDVIHASPPCQAYTAARPMHGNRHPDLVGTVRDLLDSTGKLWVIENVPGAPLRFFTTVCGLALGIKVKRHRLFESNLLLFAPPCPRRHVGEWYTVFGDGGSRVSRGRKRDAKNGTARLAMGIEWMNRRELSQAIPPAYTHYLGVQLRAALEAP